MGDPIDNKNYKKTKKEGREVYNKIGRVWCPPLDDHISFSNAGFWHLIRKGYKRRPHHDQMKRFALIPKAKEILSSPSAQISKRERTEKGRLVRFWAFQANSKNRNIRVIVRQVGNGHKHFLSVFEEDK